LSSRPLTNRFRSAAIVFAIIGSVALAALVPMFWLGVPSGHDFEFHMNSWMEVSSQWEQGIVFPRWAALANYAYGEPRFIFYPPASWLTGGALGAALPWVIVPGVYLWIVLTAAGYSMFALARRWLPRKDALFAAALYAVNPYHLIIVYWRSAFAELMASVWLPLLLLCVLRIAGSASPAAVEGAEAAPDSVFPDAGSRVWRELRSMLYLALVMAAIWLSNAPSAVMANYTLVLLVVVLATLRRAPRILFYGAGACALGLALAAFYVLPAAFEKQWVNIQEVLALGVRPQSNFLFAVIHDPDHNRFNLLVSLIAVLEIIVLSAAVLTSRHHRNAHRELWWTLTAWAGAATILMFPVTPLLWKHLPQLRFIQLPWRWLLCLNVAFALLLTLATRRWLSRALIYAAMLMALAGVWHWVQPPWWDTRLDIREMAGNVDSGHGYESVREYIPLRGSLEAIRQNAPEVSLESEPGIQIPDVHIKEAHIKVEDWAPESKGFTVIAASPGHAVLHLFNYPAWQVEVNGRRVATTTQPRTGQMVVPIQAGRNKVEVFFTRTWDRTLGAAISAVTGLLVIVFLVLTRRKTHRNPPPENADMAAGI